MPAVADHHRCDHKLHHFFLRSTISLLPTYTSTLTYYLVLYTLKPSSFFAIPSLWTVEIISFLHSYSK